MISTGGPGRKASPVTRCPVSRACSSRRAVSAHRARALSGRAHHRSADDGVPQRHLSAAGHCASPRGTSNPDGHGAFDFVWTHFGFGDDSAEMTQRLRQANLFGPAGFVSADGGEVIEFSQERFESKPYHRHPGRAGGRGGGAPIYMVTKHSSAACTRGVK